MITKAGASNIMVDLDKVERETEIPRTYLVRDEYGREFFKMYKPSEARFVFAANGWKGSIVSTLRRKQ